LFSTALALLAHSYDGRRRAVAFGTWGSVTGLAKAAGPLVGGALVGGLGWRSIFWINVPVCLAGALLGRRWLRESKADRLAPTDWAGLGLLSAALGALVYGLILAGSQGWGTDSTLAWLAAGSATLGVFVAWERRCPSPMLDLASFKVPTFAGGLVAVVAMNGSYFAAVFYLAIYLEQVQGLSAVAAGGCLMVNAAVLTLCSVALGRLDRPGARRWTIGSGLALTGAGLFLMAARLQAGSWLGIVPGLVVAGVGLGVLNPPLPATSVGVVSRASWGQASGASSTGRMVGLSVGTAAQGAFFGALLRPVLASRLHSLGLAAPRVRYMTALASADRPSQAVALAPHRLEAAVGFAIRAATLTGLRGALVFAGVIALAGALVSTWLIRPSDFETQAPPTSLDSRPGRRSDGAHRAR